MKCAVCNQGKVVQEIRDVPFTHKGYATIIKNVRGKWCTNCGEGYFGANEDDDGGRMAEEMHAFVKEVDEILAKDAEFVASVRKKLGLDQRQAAEIFGGGVNAFSRYETGRHKPPRALLQLFKILNQHPELLSEINQETADSL